MILRVSVCLCVAHRCVVGFPPTGWKSKASSGKLKSGFLSVQSRMPDRGKYSHGFQGTLILNFHRLTAAWLWLCRCPPECHQPLPVYIYIPFMFPHEIQISLEKIDAGIRLDTDTGRALQAFHNGRNRIFKRIEIPCP